MADSIQENREEVFSSVDLDGENGETPDVASSEDKIPFYKYAVGRFLSMSGSIFLDGLVGGMFLSFLLETEDSCDDRSFTLVFFIIGLSHFLCHIVQSLADYAEQALTIDATVSKLEVVINWIIWLVLLGGRVVQYPMVLVLGYYAIKFDILEAGQWTHEKEENAALSYCEANYVHLAQMTFAFQAIIGFILVSLWFVMWRVDSEDDDDEMRQQRAWKKFEKNMSSKWWGHIYVTVLLIGSQSFFNSGVASAMLALAIALPHGNCHIGMTVFLVGGLVQTIIGALHDIRIRVEEMAYLDGIINWAEYIIIQVLKFIHFPLFLVEFGCFAYIAQQVLTNMSTITNDAEFAEEHNDNYCSKGTWHFMLAVTGIYCIVFLFKVFVIIAMVIERIQNKD